MREAGGRLAPAGQLRVAVHAVDASRRAALAPSSLGAALDPASLRAALDLIESNGRAMLRYRPAPYAAPLTILIGEERSAANLHAAWAPLAPRGFELHRVPGDHYTMLRPPLVAVLADFLLECRQISLVGRIIEIVGIMQRGLDSFGVSALRR